MNTTSIILSTMTDAVTANYTTNCTTTGCGGAGSTTETSLVTTSQGGTAAHRLPCTTEEALEKGCSDYGECRKMFFQDSPVYTCLCHEGWRGDLCTKIDFSYDFAREGEVQRNLVLYGGVCAALVVLFVAFAIIIVRRYHHKSNGSDMVERGQSGRTYSQLHEDQTPPVVLLPTTSSSQIVEEDDVFEVDEQAPLTPK